MTLIELKSILKEEIEQINDLDKLEKYKILLDNINSEPVILTEWQQKRIEESEKQFENGQFISLEEANKKVEEWFKSKDAK